MAFDSQTRNKLQRMVGACRRLLADEFDEQLQGLYGIYAQDGRVLDLEKLTSLDDDHRQTATLLRDRINHLTSGMASEKQPLAEAVRRVLREQAFTVLNRFAALRMAEERGFTQECVGQGLKSKGFQVFETVARSGLGGAYERYVTFVHGIFDELSLDLGVLFDRWSPFGLLFPREPALLKFFELLNDAELKPLWKEDETVGWIYQYFNDEAERKKMREESAAPRNSRELAVRNQFFTPRYVVEFLTDNTLGRIWYEMTQGNTKLKEQCRYLVRRPNEIFLKPDDKAPEQPKQDSVSQEDLLKQPVHIPHRPLKDPRTILMLDPACGSMHFGLYAFDLFEVIYDEAWELEKRGAEFHNRPPGMLSLQESYGTKEDFLKDVPRLIIEHNLHGIDIDPRCAQIAGLSIWLRAQKAWQRLGLKPAERPAIKRSNIVCAEPMPGEKELLREFVEREFPAEERGVCLRLLEAIFDKMQLAGEAGSLLKIEEEIRSAIEDARRQWQTARQRPEFFDASQLAALDTRGGAQQELPAEERATIAADLRSLTSEDFWLRVEERIYDSLRDYAEQAENGGGFQRRLFAEDAARGFAFIDVCRKRYDVALMNPPFGAFTRAAKTYATTLFPDSANDIFAAFVECFLNRLHSGGLLGAITSRTGFFIASFEDWRREVVSKQGRILCFADLGGGVMDNATVEAAAYILQRQSSPKVNRELAPFLRYLVQTNKQPELLQVLEAIGLGRTSHKGLFWASQEHFELIAKAPVVYWTTSETKRKLKLWPPFEPSAAQVRKGLRTGNNFRFVRTLWEIPLAEFTPGISAEDTPTERARSKWVPLVLSGSSQPWFSPLLVALNWRNNGQELRQYVTKYGSPSRLIQAEEFYFKAGMSWTQRAPRLVPYTIPRGCIPTGSRPMAFPNASAQLAAVAVSASRVASSFMRFYGDWFTRPYFREGKVKLFPWPELSPNLASRLEAFVRREAERRRASYQGHEPFFDFTKPFNIASRTEDEDVSIDWSSLLGPELESAVEHAFGLNPDEAAELYLDLDEAVRFRGSGGDAAEDDEDEEDDEGGELVLDRSEQSGSESMVSHAIGCAFGRWDIRYATGAQAAPELPDPFAPLPVCPPGQLQNAQGLPARPEDVPAAYPVRIPWDGILVDDGDENGRSKHPLDIERRVYEVIEVIWKARAGDIEHEACEILGVKSLRDYFRKPAGFFADHLKRYSKSRRQAPIYWPLSTASGSYTLWIYYHRLTDQTLFQCVNDFVKPKLEDEVRPDIEKLRGAIQREGGGTKDQREKLEELEDLAIELQEFHDELLRVAGLPYKPNLNDGVLITASPLWKLFRLPKWQKDLKACWAALEGEEYEWAHLAYTIWPDRVKKVCKTDRSIAIAHGLEDLCDVKAPEKKAKRGKKKADAELELD